jgi:hypothetical protein
MNVGLRHNGGPCNMANNDVNQFVPRRPGLDSPASICIVCFETIGPHISARALRNAEKTHTCRDESAWSSWREICQVADASNFTNASAR